MENSLCIRLLGAPSIRLGETRTQDFPTEKVKLLFFYLLLFRDTTHSRTVLAGRLWGNHTDERARHSLSTALWRLRQWLDALPVPATAPYLLLQDGQIAFNTSSAYWLDVAEFEERIHWAQQMNALTPEAAAASLTRAIELYRGELMEGCYEDWCLVERSRLHQLFLQALTQLMVYHGKRREYTQAIAYGQRILQCDPLREEVHREVMKLLALNQQPAEALQQYRRCQDTLRTELNSTPMAETQMLYRKLLASSTANSSNGGSNTPRSSAHQLKPLVRKTELALKQLLAALSELSTAIESLPPPEGESVLDFPDPPSSLR